MFLFEKNTMSKNMRKKYCQWSKLPDFWFSCSLQSSLNISTFATKSIWRNLQAVLLKNFESGHAILILTALLSEGTIGRKKRKISVMGSANQASSISRRFGLTPWDKKIDIIEGFG